jgi:hypothetical protein
MGRLKNLELVFSSPTRLAANIAEEPTWVVPFVIVLVAAFTLSVLTFDYQIEHQRAEYEKIMRDRGQEEDLESLFAKTPRRRILGGVFPVAASVVVILVASAVLNGVASVAGGKIGFRRMFALYAHLSLIGVVGQLIRLPLVFAKGSVDVRTSLAAFAPSLSLTSPLGVFLNMVDLFAIWMLVALTLGYDALGHMGVRKSAAIVFGLWGALIAILVGLTYLRMVATGMS